MCTYNGSRFLDEQVQSILQQEYAVAELIVCDDRSTDDTWKKLLEWQQKDQRVKPVRNEVNLGYNRNFEKAIQLAQGELIAISDQDDIWLPQKIGKQVKAMGPSDVLLSHTRSVRLQDGRLRYKSASLHHHFKGSDTRRLFMFNQVNGHDIMIRKELVEKCVPMPEGMMYDWWIAVLATCYGTIASVDEFLVHHRIHERNNYFNEDKAAKKQPDLLDFLDMFASIPVLTSKARSFLDELRRQIKAHSNRPSQLFDNSFYKFLYENGPILFGHKKRWIPQFNYYKSAKKYAKMDFKGKGIL